MIYLYISLAIATLIPIAVLYGVHALDLYKTGTFRYVLISFISGILAYLAALVINRMLFRSGIVDYLVMIRYLAPIIEEILKAIVLLFLVRRHDFTYFIDGAIYGFSAGIGFAVVENFEYILGNPNAALSTAVTRVISTNLMHAAATATLGIVLALARFKRFSGRTAMTMLGFLLAFSIHMGFNNLVTRVQGNWVLLYAVIVGGGAAGFIALSIRRGLNDEKKWIESTLNITDHVVKEEITAIKKLDKIDRDLAPLAEIFGAKKASQIEQLLLLEARLGILKMTVQRLSDEKMRKGTEMQIAEIYQKMKQARREVGLYTMAFLRKTYLEPTCSIYKMMQVKIQQRLLADQKGEFNAFEILRSKMPADTRKVNG